MNVSAALVHLARAGVTLEVLAAELVDTADPRALRRLVDDLLRSALAENRITCGRQVAALQAAHAALFTSAECAEGDVLAARLAADLAGRQPVDVMYPCDADVAYAA